MRKKTTILVVDDEPYYLSWLFDFIESFEYSYEKATTVQEALELLEKNQYRVVIADLNIPASEQLEPVLRQKGDIYKRYPGLFVADYARNHHHTGRQVIVYSVHDSGEVRTETQRLQCTYLLKGRPRTFKEEIKDVISYDPLEHLQ